MKPLIQNIIPTLKNALLTFFVFGMIFSPLSLAITASSVDNKEVGADFALLVTHAQEQEPVTVDSTLGSPDGDGSDDQLGFLETVGAWIGDLILLIGSMFTRLGGVALEGAVEYLVIGMKDNAPLATIDVIWTFVRDICNLVFLFGFIYLGIRTIIDPDSANTKRWLSRIIIGALLINFSLYFAKVIVDLGNFTAVTIYNTGMQSFTDASGNQIEASVAGAFIDTLKLSSIYGTPDVETIKALTAGGMWTYYLMGFIFLFLTGFVFLMGAVMLITRFVTLILLLMASPLLFAAAIFPNTERIASEMWHRLIANSFYPAVFLFLVFLSLQAIGEFKSLMGGTDNPLADQLKQADSVGFASVVLLFGVSAFLLVQSIIISRKIAESGGGFGVDLMKKVHGGAQTYASRATRFALRTTTKPVAIPARIAVGKSARGLKSGFGKWQAKPKDKQSALGSVARGVVAATGVDNTVLETLDKGDKIKIGGYSLAEREKINQDRRMRLSDTAVKAEREETFKKATADVQNTAVQNDTLVKALDDLGKTMKDMTDAERADVDVSTLTNQYVAVNLNDKHIEALEKSGKFSHEEIQSIKNARKEGFKNIAKVGDASGSTDRFMGMDEEKRTAHLEKKRASLSEKSAADAGKLPMEVFAEEAMAEHLTPQMLEARAREGMSNEQQADVEKNIREHVKDPKKREMWRKWNRSARGSQFDINFAETRSEGERVIDPDEPHDM